ncbi:hypothetical protein NPIL_648471 [Nephila pilipes]|uniref:Uncharacterized protein n=1 Tax=Nephila pilipes TaxID=299642 RepID=A0A8X6PTG6_NEPPI|nr:hypothetical protein NPIL_182451 [Nephila pilipes]GFT73251.1 hypothetical protein NPIL_139781 [Nephila pilipes]GFT88371.1 hypothetical protein NPIL_119251 [Nephila pilipes]GFU53022.1 hypothetical protein NPIL_648471 [Nephila pilipes]
MNECDLPKVEYGSLKTALNLLCPEEKEKQKNCFEHIIKSVKKRVKMAATGQLGLAESASYEIARKCLEPNVNFCIAFPDNCMSIGK